MSIDPDRAEWPPEAYLLAEVYDVLMAANWQRGGDERAKRPVPHPRPGEKRRQMERTATHLERWRAMKQSEED